MNGSTNNRKIKNVITVKKGSGNTLLIDDHEVNGNSLKQAIRWVLEPSLNKGDFISFEWTSLPPDAATFDTPVISPDGNTLTMDDHNGPAAKKNVKHSYVIKVEMDEETYVSKSDDPATTMVMRDPIIINK